MQRVLNFEYNRCGFPMMQTVPYSVILFQIPTTFLSGSLLIQSQKKCWLCGDGNVEVLFSSDPDQVHELIEWLEDHHIRRYKIEDRTGIRATDLEVWQPAMSKVSLLYLQVRSLLQVVRS